MTIYSSGTRLDKRPSHRARPSGPPPLFEWQLINLIAVQRNALSLNRHALPRSFSTSTFMVKTGSKAARIRRSRMSSRRARYAETMTARNMATVTVKALEMKTFYSLFVPLCSQTSQLKLTLSLSVPDMLYFHYTANSHPRLHNPNECGRGASPLLNKHGYWRS